MLRSVIFRSLIVILVLLLAVAGMLYLVQDGMIYHPRPYSKNDLREIEVAGLDRLDFETGEGEQVAFYRAPSTGAAAQRVWLVFGGNGGRAADYRNLASDVNDGYLFVDYPSYGLCDGDPSPASIDQSVDGALAALGVKLSVSVEALSEKLCVVGHSIGAAVGLRAAVIHEVDRVVIMAPFTTMKEIAAGRVGNLFSNVLRHRFDNLSTLEQLKEANPAARVTILTGNDDWHIPPEMSQRLAKQFPEMVELQLLNGVGHNDILNDALLQVLEAMTPLNPSEK